jgi:hypothetical protein
MRGKMEIVDTIYFRRGFMGDLKEINRDAERLHLVWGENAVERRTDFRFGSLRHDI